MPSFICKVMTPHGQIIKVKLVEEDKISCLKKLKRNGMTPIEIKKAIFVSPNITRKISASISAKKKEDQKIKLSKKFVKSIKLDDLKTFTKEFLFLKQSNFSNEYALKVLIANTQNINLKGIIKEIQKNCEKDIYIYETMEKYTQIFPLIYINLIKNGELTGFFDEGLKNALAYLENEEKVTNIMQEKLFPNILLIFTTILIMFLSVTLGIPLIQNLLSSINGVLQLPLITRIAINICNFIIYNWYVFVALIIIGISAIVLFFKNPAQKYKLDKFKYKNKIFGKLLYFLDFSRIARCLYVNIQNKMRIQDSLEVCKGVVKNTYMLEIIEKSINNVFKGRSWVDVYTEDKILNPITIELMKKNKDLKSPESMQKTIEYIEYQIDKETENLILRITEMSYIILGILFLLYICIVLLPSISVYLSSFLLF